MKKYFIIFWWLLFILSAWFGWEYYRHQNKKMCTIVSANNGVFNFSQVDLSNSPNQHLHGQVYFFWDTLIDGDKLTDSLISASQSFIKIPQVWGSQQVNNETISNTGYGTYYFKIIVPKPGEYGIKVKEIETAYHIWINGIDYGGAGVVGKSKTEMTPSWRRQEHYFHTDSSEVDVTIQVSNFRHRKGGIAEVIYFGEQEHLIRYKLNKSIFDAFILGILFILFLYHFWLAYHRRSDLSLLFFSLLSLTMFLRMGTTSEKLLVEYLTWIPWSVALKVEYISLMAIPMLIVIFYRSLLPKEVNRLFMRITAVFNISFMLFVLLTPARIFSYSIIIFQYATLLVALVLFVQLLQAVIKHRDFAFPLFTSYFFFLIFFINDYLSFNKYIETPYLIPVGMLTIMITQAIVLSKKTATAFNSVEVLSNKLKQYTQLLEEKVEERTQQISEQKAKIEKQKKNLEQQTEQLLTSNNQLVNLARFKKEMTSMLVHDLKTPINNIIGFSQVDLELDKYKNIMLVSGSSMRNLISNILDVDKYEQTKMSLNITDTNPYSIARKAFEQTLYMVLSKDIAFSNALSKTEIISMDAKVMERVFVNIFSNATKYKNENGIIKLWSERVTVANKPYYKVYIYNSGEPIPLDKLEAIFNKYEQLHEGASHISYSTGLGLTYCKLAIEAHHGQIGATSGKDKGVTFWFTLPIT